MKPLGSGLRWNTLNALIGQGASLGRLVLVAAATGPAVAGKYAIAAAIVGGAAILTEVGFRQQFISTPLETEESDIHHRLSVAWTLNLSLRIIVVVIALLLIGGNQFSGFAASDTLLAALGLAIANMLAAATNPKLLERERLGDFRPNTYCESGGQLVGLAVVLVGLPSHASLELLVFSQIIASASQAAASYLMASRHMMTSIGIADLMQMARNGRSYMVIAAMTYATYGLDKLVLGWLVGPQSVGAYYMAQRLAEIPVFAFAAVVGKTVLPAYLKAEHGEPRVLPNIVRTYTQVLFLLFIPSYLIALAITHTEWFATLTPNWADARTLISLLLVAAAFRLGCHLISPAMVIRNDVATDARFKVQEAVLFVPALVIATWILGAVGAATCAIGLYAISWWRRYRFVSRYQKISPSSPP